MESQQYEEKERGEQKLVMVSWQHERMETRRKDETGNMTCVETDRERCENDATASRYSSPKSTTQVTAITKGGVPVKTQEQTVGLI